MTVHCTDVMVSGNFLCVFIFFGYCVLPLNFLAAFLFNSSAGAYVKVAFFNLLTGLYDLPIIEQIINIRANFQEHFFK